MSVPFATGYVQIYTGNGKGKTTAALGLALRAAGHGLRTYIAQFMKGQLYGELNSIRLIPEITIEQFGDKTFIHADRVTSRDIQLSETGLKKARVAMLSGKYQIIVLDEINVAIHYRLLALNQVLNFISSKPPAIELILTGRYAPEELIARADLVTEMVEIKHYWKQNVIARDGIER